MSSPIGKCAACQAELSHAEQRAVVLNGDPKRPLCDPCTVRERAGLPLADLQRDRSAASVPHRRTR